MKDDTPFLSVEVLKNRQGNIERINLIFNDAEGKWHDRFLFIREASGNYALYTVPANESENFAHAFITVFGGPTTEKNKINTGKKYNIPQIEQLINEYSLGKHSNAQPIVLCYVSVNKEKLESCNCGYPAYNKQYYGKTEIVESDGLPFSFIYKYYGKLNVKQMAPELHHDLMFQESVNTLKKEEVKQDGTLHTHSHNSRRQTTTNIQGK